MSSEIKDGTAYILEMDAFGFSVAGVYIVDGTCLRCTEHEFKYDQTFKTIELRNRFLAGRTPATEEQIGDWNEKRNGIRNPYIRINENPDGSVDLAPDKTDYGPLKGLYRQPPYCPEDEVPF